MSTNAAASPKAIDGRFVSHAQYGEDVRLWRALGHVAEGRYVDVGAQDPDDMSVTRAFYDRGWSGINVEPVPAYAAKLRARRPRDVTLEAALAAMPGERTLHEVPDTGLSTLDPAIARWHADQGRSMRSRTVAIDTLERVWIAHAVRDVHFLKVDVEGAEPEVLAGIDLDAHRPWIVVVEATRPMTRIPSYAAWEPRLLAARYRLACDDGVNRYYVADEHADLAPALALPLEARDDHVLACDVLAADPARPAAARYGPERMGFLHGDWPRPTMARPVSQLCTRAQFREGAYRDACLRMSDAPLIHRRQWENVYALATLEALGAVGPGKRGLILGTFSAALPAVLAAAGCVVTVVASRVDRASLAGAVERGLCSDEAFKSRVLFVRNDADALAQQRPGSLDFVCTFELADTIGAIERTLAVIKSSFAWLRSGAAAVHTGTFNLSSNYGTIETRGTCALRRFDLETIGTFAARAGFAMAPLTLFDGDDPVDAFVATPPYVLQPNLKFRVDRYVLTSIGLAFSRAP
jgi:FkbM family methyltransferase